MWKEPDEEIRKLHQEIKDLKEERDILIPTSRESIFSKKSR